MATLLADPPAAAPTEQPSAAGPAGGAVAPGGDAHAPVQRSCSNCGSPLDGAQDWCLQCGAGAPESLATRTPGWRSAAAVLAALAILVAGAATAAYAALSKGSGRARPATVAQTTAPATTTPVVPATPEATGTATAKVGTPTTVKPILPLGTVKPPKIPISATPTPKSAGTSAPSGTGGAKTPATTTPKSGTEGGGSSASGEAQPEAILLDTDAAATYNPYGYTASNFGDPSLAVDGDTSTGWTAEVEPSVAPKMAEGLVVDLNTPQKISALVLNTSTPGMTVQVYGANGQAPPTSITDPAWVALSPALVDKKKHTRIKLGTSTKAAALAAKKPYRFIVLWISRAPAASIGTAQAPGHVSVNELEFFPLKK